jgi:DNA-directed RNA polymerase specialized sigma24 family protein
MNEVTIILSAIEKGDRHAADQLLPLVYDELRKLAAAKLAHESPGQTLQATALVHEAYLRLVASPGQASPGPASPGRESGESKPQWDSRAHFFAAAAEAMRRILVENARHKRSQKAGHGCRRQDLNEVEATVNGSPDDLLALDDALTKLGRENAAAAELAKLRLFTGLTVDEAADTLGISRRTGFRLWTYARAFLQADLSDDPDSPQS